MRRVINKNTRVVDLLNDMEGYGETTFYTEDGKKFNIKLFENNIGRNRMESNIIGLLLVITIVGIGLIRYYMILISENSKRDDPKAQRKGNK